MAARASAGDIVEALVQIVIGAVVVAIALAVLYFVFLVLDRFQVFFFVLGLVLAAIGALAMLGHIVLDPPASSAGDWAAYPLAIGFFLMVAAGFVADDDY